MNEPKQILQERLTQENFAKLSAIDNAKLHKFVADVIELANPASVFVCTDADEDIQYIRDLSKKNGEEKQLAIKSHTIHYDGYDDQARDKSRTKYLLPKGSSLGSLSSMDKEEGTAEVRGFFKDSMVGREMLVCFFCLGPTDSPFSIPCAQITDSAYVAHSETILYRWGYEQFKKIGDSGNFFRFMHTSGEVGEDMTSVNIDKRRVYIDLEDNLVYSTNTQYAGNTVGLKKLALRLAINKSSQEGWLAEHMFVMGAHGPGGRVTYFTGAFPSACGKTSTSMLGGQSIVGDDIAYLRKIDGQIRTVNVEKGIFGIIRDVNHDGDPVIYDALTSDNEVIFSNILIDEDNNPAWLGMGKELPEKGVNHSGAWQKGKTDDKGNEITASHKNARYCLNISDLSNMDPKADAPEGVQVGGVVYGGRDSDTWVPVEQAYSWEEGILIKGAAIESETTAATLGAEGVRTFNLMSNLDFLSIPLGQYIQNNLDFVKDVKDAPMVFSTNYFLRGSDGKYLNGIGDKLVWILWAELRVNGDVDVIKTPTGMIPKYEDLAKLFKEKMNAEYTKANYEQQFTYRIVENLAKLDRVEKIYRDRAPDTPQTLYDTFNLVRDRLKAAGEKYGNVISPFDLKD